jgi:pimeloyl-ACP methyl ester carboxylesterase
MSIPEPARTQVSVAADVALSVIERRPDPTMTAGTPVLLVHGLASNARMWDGVADALACLGHPSVALDQRGHGRSDTPDDGYDFETLGADLVAVMDAIGLDRPIVVGQSWGANVVLELADRHPDRVSGVVCVDGGFGAFRDELPDWATAERALTPPDLVGTPLTRLEGWVRTRHADWPESGIAGTLANFRVRDDGTIEPWLTRPRHMTIARHLWEHDPVALYARLGVPVLLLVADPADASGRRERAVTALEATGGDLRVRWFRPGDHDLHAQFPERVAAAIDELAREVGA